MQVDINLSAADLPQSTPEERSQYIKLRRLEIAATLAQWKHEFYTSGVQRPMVLRTGLEAEDARLALEARKISSAANAAAVERRARLNAGLLAQLVALLEARGMHDLVADATRMSEAALEAMEGETA